MSALSAKQLEASMAEMLPAAETLRHDGWLLRLTPGISRNPNSVWTLEPGNNPLSANIDFCEGRYEKNGLACSFRLTDDDNQAGIEEALLNRGYVIHNPNTVLVKTLDGATGDPIDLVGLDGWLNTILEIDDEMTEAAVELKRGPLSRIQLPSRYGLVTEGDTPRSYGRAVLQDDLYQLAELWTHPECRNRGLGTRLILGLLNIGQQMGATTAFMPVSDNNPGARRLYERLGFTAVYRYKYLIAAS